MVNLTGKVIKIGELYWKLTKKKDFKKVGNFTENIIKYKVVIFHVNIIKGKLIWFLLELYWKVVISNGNRIIARNVN